MRLLACFSVVALFAIAHPPDPAFGGTDPTRQLVFTATVLSRTSLRVSTSELRFEALDSASAPTVVVDFTAAARTRADGEVVLTVERSARGGRAMGNVPDEAIVSFEGEGGSAGALDASGPRVVGTWKGSGVRQGRLLFTLHGAPAPGIYVVAVKFALSVR